MPEHTIAENLTRLQNAKTAIGNAITAKGGTVNSGDGLEEYAADIATIPTGTVSAERKDVNFYDFDGSIVYSYTADEFAELSALPANPSHAGLTAQGWNWSLADAKAYVADYGMLDIGQMYITDDGKTRLYITLTEGRLKPYLGLTGNSAGTAVNIDWGDGSVSESVTLDANTVYTPHEYASGGDYVIAVEVTNGTIKFNQLYSGETILKGVDVSSYILSIYKVEIGDKFTLLGSQSLKDGLNFTITIPQSVTSIGNSALQGCTVGFVAIPSGVSVINTSTFSSNNMFKGLSLPNTIGQISDYAFNSCKHKKINLPNSVERIGKYSFLSNVNLSEFYIPFLVDSIGTAALQGCTRLGVIKFFSTNPPTIDNVNAWTNIPSDCYILVPYDTLDDYLNETNMPDDSVYLYLCFAKYAEGVTLPTEDSDGYSLTWYATKDDARNGINPITVGNGKEIYAIGV